MPPAACYLLRAIEERLARRVRESAETRARHQRIGRTIGVVEHVLALQRDIQTLVGQWKLSSGAWLPHGAPLWLVGTAPRPATRDEVVIAVRADALVKVAPGFSPAFGERISLVSGNGEGE